jgi:RND family efflux transporter MFP subunit
VTGPALLKQRMSIEELRIDRDRPPTAKAPRFLLAALVVAVLALLLFWWRHAQAVPAVHVSVAIEAGGGGAHETVLNASGYVTARRQATVSSKVTGQITEVLFEEGQKVPEGQVLARVDPSNLETSLHLAQAQLEVAQTALGETRTQWREASNECFRVLSLASNNVASPSEADKARAEADALAARLEREQAEVTVARRQIATWQQQLDDTVLRAPFAGVIVSKTAQPGEIISPLSAGGGFTRTGICTLVDMTSLEVEVDVNENYINRVFPAQPVQAVLDAYPDWKIPAHVIAIIPTADRQKGTVKVRVGFEQLDPRMLPDMGVKVSFEAAPSAKSAAAAVVIPPSALRQENGADAVWILRQGRALSRPVQVSATNQDQMFVTTNVAAGEKVIVDGPPGLRDGAAVREIQP